jgi:flagellar biosynthetic protein FliQ
MNETTVIDLARETVYVALLLAAPALAVGMIVGILVAIFQAVTSVQEQTMTLVPKLFCVCLTLLVIMPWMLTTLLEFTRRMFSGIATVAG